MNFPKIKRSYGLDAKFYSDDWESYAKVIPAEKLSTGKQHTVGIEQNK